MGVVLDLVDYIIGLIRLADIYETSLKPRLSEQVFSYSVWDGILLSWVENRGPRKSEI